MPMRDGTGPLGLGTMTGRRLGFCNSNASSVQGRGFGFGRRFCLRRYLDIANQSQSVQKQNQPVNPSQSNKV